MKNVLSNKKVVPVLFALQKNFWKRNPIKLVFEYRFNSNKHAYDVFVRNTSFVDFYCTNMHVFFGVQSGFIWNHWIGDLHVTVEHRYLDR